MTPKAMSVNVAIIPRIRKPIVHTPLVRYLDSIEALHTNKRGVNNFGHFN